MISTDRAAASLSDSAASPLEVLRSDANPSSIPAPSPAGRDLGTSSDESMERKAVPFARVTQYAEDGRNERGYEGM